VDKGNILYIGNLLLPDGDAASHRSIGNAKVLRKLGYRVSFLGCRNGVASTIFDSKEIYQGFDMYFFSKPDSICSWTRYLFSYLWFTNLINYVSPCAIILYNHPSVATNKIRKYCKRMGIKCYADCTEWYAPKGYSIHALIKKADTWYRMQVVNPKLDGIICISTFLSTFYSAKGAKTICVPPLVDKCDTKWNRSEATVDGKLIRLIYAGNPGADTKDKLSLIIDSMRLVLLEHNEIEIEFNVIGITAQEYLDLFGNASVEPFVHFFGRVPNNETLSWIKSCDYSIFIRDKNIVCTAGFPTKFSESIACGTPVLTNDTSDIMSYLIQSKNGFLLDSSSSEGLCKSLFLALSVGRKALIEMKNYCKTDMSLDYHSFENEFSKMF
jgi:glycosyltransferase involved in cell wall biosynthesis